MNEGHQERVGDWLMVSAVISFAQNPAPVIYGEPKPLREEMENVVESMLSSRLLLLAEFLSILFAVSTTS
jgi:hypothetical protein